MGDVNLNGEVNNKDLDALDCPQNQVTLTLFDVEDRLHLGKTQKKFGFSLDLDNFLTLKNANLFEFSSLNRNFALSLHRDSEKSHP
jgi:hypothetical protein